MITGYIFTAFLIILGLAVMRFGSIHVKKFKEGKTKINPYKKINFNFRGWAGDFHNDKEIPNQYRTYLSGGIDPTFSSHIYDRTGQSNFSLMQNQYIQSGPALRGLLKKDNLFVSSESMVWGVNLDAKIALLPIHEFK